MRFIKSALCGFCALLMLPAFPAVSAYAARSWHQIGFMGDLNNNAALETDDVAIMVAHLLGRQPLTNENSYYIETLSSAFTVRTANSTVIIL